MARKKTGIEFEGFEEVISRLKAVNADVISVTEKALKKSHKVMTQKAEMAIQPHSERFSGKTKKSLVKKPTVEWSGGVATVKVGFDISHGGLPSIFLMYGTPTTPKDQKLYNAFYGKKTRDEVMNLQEEIFYEEIRKSGG